MTNFFNFLSSPIVVINSSNPASKNKTVASPKINLSKIDFLNIYRTSLKNSLKHHHFGSNINNFFPSINVNLINLPAKKLSINLSCQ